MNNENSNGLVLGAGAGFGSAVGLDLTQMTQAEKLELAREIYRNDKAIEYAGLEYLKSQDLIGIPLTILDARFGEVTEVDKRTKESYQKPVVNFMMQNQETSVIFVVTKAANSFNNAYVDYFAVRAGIAEQPLYDYEFVSDSRYGNDQNDAIILRRIQKQAAKTVTPKA